jgi:DNA-binding NarL/FixJ family response regulator
VKLSELTPRRRQIVELIRDGLSDKEIGAKLGIEAQTVKNMLRNVYRETRTCNRVTLIRHFYEVTERVA